MGTYFITLPAEWVEDHRLEKGIKLDFFRDDQDNLVIKPREQRDAS